jgi:hypothetical protein
MRHPRITRIATNLLARVVCLAVAAFLPGASPAEPAAATSADSAVRAFYRAHFARRDLMAICREGIDRDRPHLTPELYRLLRNELDRYDKEASAHGGSANFKPFVVGDVFTASEELPDAFRVGAAAGDRRKARVPVTFTWKDGATPPKTVTVVAVSSGGRWAIDDVLYPDGINLVDLLSRPEYDSFGT